MAFNGKLIELWIPSENHYVDFPQKIIKAESYKVTPDQRMETSASRSASGVLKRTTATHTASKIEFNTVPINNTDISAIHGMLLAAYSDQQQRKLYVRYYDPAVDDYKGGDFYIPDIDYNILRIDTAKNVIYYDSIRFAFIEY